MSTPTSANSLASGLAVASLTLAILSIVLGPFGCIPAIICGHIALAKIRRDPTLRGGGLAIAGLIIGYIFLLYIFALTFIFGIFSPIVTPPVFQGSQGGSVVTP